MMNDHSYNFTELFVMGTPYYEFSFLSACRDIFSQIEWVGHVTFMGDMRNLYKISVGKVGGERPFGRPRL
jgi:hypothetical protein